MAYAQLLVGAAADLAPLERPLSKEFKRVSGNWLRFVIGSSGMLARQIESGAPYDVFLSANEQYVTGLAASGHLRKDSVRVYALGRLGLWSRSKSIRGFNDLGGAAHVAIANPAHAPYGIAAKQALENQGVWKQLEPKIVYAENVRQTLEYAQSGNAEAALTAWSLVFDKGGVLLPAEWHAPIRQAGGILKSSKQVSIAQKFMDLLVSPAGQALLSKFGLSPPPR